MSKSITIPTDRGSVVEVSVNGVKYVYMAGATVTVPDEVAEAVVNSEAMKPSGVRESAADAMLADVKKDIKDLKATDGELDAAIDALDERLTALDDDDTGKVPELDGRVTALEEAAGGGGGGGD